MLEIIYFTAGGLWIGYFLGVGREAERTYRYLSSRWNKNRTNHLLSECLTGLVLKEHHSPDKFELDS